MVTSKMISPEDFRARRILARHKQVSLAHALQCTAKTIRNFELRKTKRLYSVNWPDLVRELQIQPAH